MKKMTKTICPSRELEFQKAIHIFQFLVVLKAPARQVIYIKQHTTRESIEIIKMDQKKDALVTHIKGFY